MATTKSFSEFVDKKTREAKKQLKLVEKLLEKRGLKIKSHLEEVDPYVYVEEPTKQLSFGGVRVYKIGDSISFRVQKEEKTHPYGKAYQLDIEGMYKDLLSDDMSETKAGEEVITAVTKEIRNFFVKSSDAEKDLRSMDFERGDGVALAGDGGSDYSSMVHNSGRQYGHS